MAKTGRKTSVIVTPQVDEGSTPVDVEASHIRIAKTNEELKNPHMLVSRLNFPVNIKYGHSMIRLSPRAKVKVADASLIKGKLPQGVMLNKIKK